VVYGPRKSACLRHEPRTYFHSECFIGVVSKFCSQQDLTKMPIPIKSDIEQKAYDTYAANDRKENVVSDSYETICMLSSKAMTL